MIQFERGASHALAGREEAGIADTRVALQLAEELGYRTLAPRIATQLGDLLTAAGEHECASAAFRKALSFKPV